MELKNKKGITPVIAVVMLLLVTVGVVGVSSVWFSGILSASTKKFISIPAGGAYCSGGEIKVYALNNGDTTITTQDIVVAQVDGADVKGTPFFGDISSGLVGWWKFDEGAGSTATDSSGYGNTGTLTNMDPLSDWVTGRFGKALDFDGVDDNVNLGRPATLQNLNDFTISAWVYPTSLGTDNIVAQDDGGGFDNGELLFRITGGQYSVGLDGLTASMSGGTPITNAWTHVAFTVVANNRMDLYVNGVNVASDTTIGTTAPYLHNTGSSLRIGNKDVNEGFDGRIDEARIYNKATGDVSIPPSKTSVVINYPALQGRHTVRIGTSSGVAETSVICA